MERDKSWKKYILSNEFISESCGFIIDNNELCIIAGEWIWKLNGEKRRIREIKDAWLPPWPYKDRYDKHASLREGGGEPQYKADTYDFVDDLTGNGLQDIITVGMHKDPIYWYENPGKQDGLWEKHLLTEGGVYESVLYKDLFNNGHRQIITIPHKPEIAWVDPRGEFHNIHNIGAVDGDWHGLGLGDVNNDGKNEILTPNFVYSQNNDFENEWRRKSIITIDEDGTKKNGLGDVFLIEAVKWDSMSQYPVLFSSSPHGFGFYYWVLEDIDEDRYLYKKYKISDDVSQLHSIKVMKNNGKTYVFTGKRYMAHGRVGDVDIDGKAYVLSFEISDDGTGRLYCIDDDSGAGIKFDAITYNNKMYIATSNKKGLFLFEGE